jgi:hypothetical protein
MAKRKITKGQAMIYKTLLRKLKIEQYDLFTVATMPWLAVPEYLFHQMTTNMFRL